MQHQETLSLLKLGDEVSLGGMSTIVHIGGGDHNVSIPEGTVVEVTEISEDSITIGMTVCVRQDGRIIGKRHHIQFSGTSRYLLKPCRKMPDFGIADPTLTPIGGW